MPKNYHILSIKVSFAKVTSLWKASLLVIHENIPEISSFYLTSWNFLPLKKFFLAYNNVRK